MNQEYLLHGLLLNNFMNNDNKYISVIILFLLTLLINQIELIKDFLSGYFETKKCEIHFCQEDKEVPSKRYKAIMHYIVKNPNPTIRILADHVIRGYNNDDILEEKTQIYRINQYDKFLIDKDIYGSFKVENREVKRYSDVLKIEIFKMSIYSEKLSVMMLKDWVEDRLVEYEKHLEDKLLNEQYIFTIKSEEKTLLVDAKKWSSNVTFENRFFENKEEILDKINFFLNNKEWYESKGIPYTLGILLYGEPGCGKTSFIKALLNLTKRHAVDIKLNGNFDFNNLTDIMNKDKINDEYSVPSNKKIIILEDIDCMDNIVKSRYKKEDDDISDDIDINKSDKHDKHKSKKDDNNMSNELKNLIKKINQKTKNSLSELLNIFDGIEESDGRIVIMTSNKPEDLDPALIRPGRIDIKINFRNASFEDFKKIVNHYYNNNNNLEIDDLEIDDLKLLVDYIYTPAEIINICRGFKNINDLIDYLHKNI